MVTGRVVVQVLVLVQVSVEVVVALGRELGPVVSDPIPASYVDPRFVHELLL
jgi:hypothetical protein